MLKIREVVGESKSRLDPSGGAEETSGGLSTCTDTALPRGTERSCHGGTGALGDEGTG